MCSGPSRRADSPFPIFPGEPGKLLRRSRPSPSVRAITGQVITDWTEHGGQVFVNDLDVTKHPQETKQFLGYIPEQVMLYKDLTGLENLEYFSSLSRRRRLPRHELKDLLSRVHLAEEAWKRRVVTYSKGMRQKVAIAIALSRDARAFLFDEPTAGLDPKASNEFSALISQLKENQMAILMATHDLFRARESGTRLGIMKHGQLVETLHADSIGHADLEQLYLRHMHD